MDWFGRRLERLGSVALWTALTVAPLGLVAGAVAAAAEGPAPTTAAEAAQQGEPLFKAHCASCHDPAVGRAPDRAQLDRMGTLEVLNALLNGSMRPMAQGMTDHPTRRDRHLCLAARRRRPHVPPPPDPPKCAKLGSFAPRKPATGRRGAATRPTGATRRRAVSRRPMSRG